MQSIKLDVKTIPVWISIVVYCLDLNLTTEKYLCEFEETLIWNFMYGQYSGLKFGV